MPNRIDELFSPQRLRRTWNRRIREPLWQWNQPACAGTNVNADGSGTASRRGADEERYASSEALPAGPQGIRSEFDRLKRLIRQRFPGKQGEALDIMLENLHKLLTQRFPQTGKAAVPKEAAASEDKAAVPKEAAASEDKAVSGNEAIMEDDTIPDDDATPGNNATPENEAFSEDDMTAIDQSIEEVLNQIEDLVEALEL
jgi:hypothetical protein